MHLPWQVEAQSPRDSPRLSVSDIPFSTHHNVTCLNWYCACAVATADEDCFCQELTGRMCEACDTESDFA